MQDLHDTLRSMEAEQMDEDSIIDSSGKEKLGASLYVGLTVTLLNAQVAFEERSGPVYIQCLLDGGNLVAVDENGDEIFPVHPTAYTQVVRTSSSSATLMDISAMSDTIAAAVLDDPKALTVPKFLALK